MKFVAARGAFLAGLVVWILGAAGSAQAQVAAAQPFPYSEKLDYRIEWRLITAGTAHVELAPVSPDTWETKLLIESAGFVTRLYRVYDEYNAITNGKFCGATVTFSAQEGKRRRFTTLNFNDALHQVHYEEKDLLHDSVHTKNTGIAPCTHELTGALATLRMMHLEPGKTVFTPITDGKKMAMARIEAQERESLTVDGKTYSTIRYEAFLFDNVLYPKKGRLWVWMTDDAERLPVQIRVRLAFPIGNITLLLDKAQREPERVSVTQPPALTSK